MARKAPEGGRQGCAPGRWKGGASLFSHMSAQAAHSAGGGKGRGLVGQHEGLGLNTTRAGRAPLGHVSPRPDSKRHHGGLRPATTGASGPSLRSCRRAAESPWTDGRAFALSHEVWPWLVLAERCCSALATVRPKLTIQPQDARLPPHDRMPDTRAWG